MSSTGPAVTQEVVGPKEARKWLAANTRNRDVRDPVVRAYARDMVAGRWYPAVGVIAFDPGGVLLNGQHTLLAVIEASRAAGRDIFVSVIVVRGQDQAAQDVMDTGSKRRFGDQLAIRDEPNSTVLAGAIRIAYVMSTFGAEFPSADKSLSPTHEELFDWLVAHPEIRHHITLETGLREIRFPPAQAAALRYLMTEKAGKVEADAFWHKVSQGDGLSVGDPVYALRRSLINDLTASRKMSRVDRLVITIKAWNATRRGQRVKVLMFREDETFPVIE